MNQWKVTLQDRVICEFHVAEGQALVVGRGAEADVVIDNTAISRRHLSLQLLNGTCFVADLGSTNGTRINGEPVTMPTVVEPGDVVTAGKFQLVPLPEKTHREPAPHLANLDATVFVAPRPDAARPAATSRPPRLTVVQGSCDPAGCSTENRPEITVGKGPGCDLRVRGWWIGNPQCRVVSQGSGHALVHAGGWRATTLNGASLRDRVPLKRGDVIGVGAVRLRFE